jgi:hypothetical protein
MLATDLDRSRLALAHRTNALGALFEWLAKPPRFNLHLTPTSAGRPSLVEQFFHDVTNERLQRGVLASAIDFDPPSTSTQHITKPNPFIWTQSARDIQQKGICAKPA